VVLGVYRWLEITAAQVLWLVQQGPWLGCWPLIGDAGRLRAWGAQQQSSGLDVGKMAKCCVFE